MDGNNINNNTFGVQNNTQQPQQTYQQQFNSGVNYGAPQMAPVQLPQNPQDLEPVSIGTWLGIMFLSLIPCVNIVMLFVWAFSEGKESRKNWAKATLIFCAILIVLDIIISVAFGAAILSFLYELAGM